MESRERLFRAVRDRAPTDAWSRGVTLQRNGAVRLERMDEPEVEARVAVPGSVVAARVELYLPEPTDEGEPGDGEWECDCDSSLDACEHVAAAVIALSRHDPDEQTRPGSESEELPRLVYRFRRTPSGLHFSRELAGADGFTSLTAPLDSLVSSLPTGFRATTEDLRVERVLLAGGQLEGVLPSERLPRLLATLSPRSNLEVWLDEEPVRVSEKSLSRFEVRVRSDGDGYHLQLRENPEVEESFRNGCGLASGVLRPLTEPRLTGTERHQLSQGRHYSPIEVAELVGEVLPSLERRLPLDVRTDRLPARARSRGSSRPRLSLRFADKGDSLYVLATIVYGDPPTARVEGERLVSLSGEVPLRDREAERALEERLRRERGLLLGQGEELEAEEAVAFVEGLASWEGRLEGKEHERFHRTEPLTPHWALEEGRFDLGFQTDSNSGADADAGTVLRAFREGRSLIPLLGPEGGFAPLPVDWLSRYGEMVSDLLAARDREGKLPASALPDLGRFCEAMGAPPPPELETLRALLRRSARGDAEAPSEIDLDPALAERLRAYQREAVVWLRLMREAGLGALLADDMGLGKTRQALAVLPGGEGRSLVAAPTSVLHGWQKEAERFRPDLRLSLYHGAARRLDPHANVILTSHALLRNEQERFAKFSWDVLVIDEAQVMKNPDSQIARAIHGSTASASFRLCLSGTPVENRLEELWSQFHFLNPGLLGSLDDFRERYARPIEAGEPEPRERLRERIAPFFLRRLKSQVAPELPPRTELSLRALLEEEERILYESIRLATRRDLLAKLNAGGNVLGALTALLRLRQAACHPALVPGQRPSPESSSKTRLLLERLRIAGEDDHKSLVFSQWTSMLDLLEPLLRSEGIDYLRLDGATKDRASVVEGFQSPSGPPVLLVSLKAGGTGLNLTAADHVFLFDPWWNPAVEQQAADRTHRIGQEKPVFVYRLVAADTVEERILELQEKKRDLSELATGGRASGSTLTREELLALLD